MGQSACLVINPMTVDNVAALFNCTSIDRASDTMMAQPKAIHFSYLKIEKLQISFFSQISKKGLTFKIRLVVSEYQIQTNG